MCRSNWSTDVVAARSFVRTAAWTVGVLLLALMPAAARAQGTGRSMDFDTSIRSSGMGGASAGVTWGDPNVWGNVASLSRVTGIRWEHSRTQLVPGLATDVWITSNRLLVGASGVGVSLLGIPALQDGVRLDYGTAETTDINGNVTGTFDSFESVNGQAVAVSLPRILDALVSMPAGLQHLPDALDVSLGLARKRTHIQLAPRSLSGIAEGTTYDLGVQARFSPLWLLPAPAGSLSPRDFLLLDLGLGYSSQNAMGDKFVFSNAAPAVSAARLHRSGTAARLGLRVPPLHGVDRLVATLLEGIDPLVAVGYASDHDDNGPRYRVDHSGYEITIANVYTYRHGTWSDPLGQVDGPTTGWGLGAPLGPWGGFRYDESTMPQARGADLPDVTRKGWTAWFDVVRVWQDLHIGAGGGAHAQ